MSFARACPGFVFSGFIVVFNGVYAVSPITETAADVPGAGGGELVNSLQIYLVDDRAFDSIEEPVPARSLELVAITDALVIRNRIVIRHLHLRQYAP